MKQLIMCQGLPGSGKSTWAQQQRLARFKPWDEANPPSPIYVVNKDTIRCELEAGGWTWSPEKEAKVIAIRDQRIINAFDQGCDVVISDDTNFGRKHAARLQDLAKRCRAEFSVQTFDTHIEECIRRDALREGKARVGKAVILSMATKYGIAPLSNGGSIPSVVLPDATLPPAIICDLDGTLSLFQAKGHRGPYDATLCDQDELNKPVALVLEVFYRFMGYKILYVSGRFECFRPQTEAFMRNNHCPPGDLLLMRMDGDSRRDDIVKGELFDTDIRGKYNVKFVLDDRDRVVQFWRQIGLTCFQVAPGAF